MATPLSSTMPNVLLSPFPCTTRNPNSLFPSPNLGGFFNPRTSLRGSVFVARLGFKPGLLPDPENSESLIKDLFGRAESFLYTIADAAVANSDTVDATTTSATKQSGDWLSGITYAMESVLKVLKDGLSALHVPYAYGFAIILLTVLVKAATFPLTKKQVESAMAMRSLQPQVKAIQQRYAGDQEKIQIETARLYKLAGINPLAGCLPTLATIPVWIGLYRALSNVADEGLLTEGFFWIPSLAGPTTIAARQNGSGISWLFPFVDGHPPLGWSDTLAYLVLPVLLVVSQYISVQIMQSSQSNDPNMKTSQAITKFLPLMIGYFSLSVPSGLSLYWLTNNILSTGQQVWLQKLGGAKIPARQFNDDIIRKDLESQKSVTELSSTKVEVKQKEELTPEGLRRGERFKQLKEQEARIRKQREEEKRKAEEAARGSQIESTKPDKEANSDERETGTNVNGGDRDNKETATVIRSSTPGSGGVNGNLSSHDATKVGETASLHGMEKSEVSISSEVRQEDEKLVNEEKQKEAVKIGGVNSTEDNLSEQDKHQVRRE